MIDLRTTAGPYGPLATQWEGAMSTLSGGAEAPGPELVATSIANALETDGHPIRLPVGSDAELITSTRQASDYETFEGTMRQVLQLDW
jgi:hypothetical protein